MPQPLTETGGLSYSPNAKWVFSHRPECVAAIGLVALQWTRVEDQFTSMISGILGRTSRGDGGGWSINPNWIIKQVMGASDNIRSRIRIVESVLLEVLEGHALVADWEALSKRAYKRARDRNIVVHTSWAWSESHPNGLLATKPDQKYSLWVEQDFLDAYERILQLEHDLHEFMKLVLIEIHEGRIVSRITPDMVDKA